MPVRRRAAASAVVRRAAAALVATNHEAQLAGLLEHVRDGLSRDDVGDLDAFEVGDVVHQYTRAARELWKLCAVSGARVETVAATLQMLADDGEEIDWWERGAPRRRDA